MTTPTGKQSAGHTRGPLKVIPSYSNGKGFGIEGPDGHICTFEDYSEAGNDAALFAEAGTVAHETGLTPRQLADELTTERVVSSQRQEEIKVLTSQRSALLEALKALRQAYWMNATDAVENRYWNKPEMPAVHKEAWLKARVAIAKAQQEGL